METVPHPAFYRECVNYIFRLEQRLDRVRNINVEGPNSTKLETLKLMLMDVADFATAQEFGTDLVETSEISSIYEKIKRVESLIAASSWGVVKRWFGSHDSKSSEFQSSYGNLRVHFTTFLKRHFDECMTKHDVSAEEQEAFRESVNALHSDLKRIW